MLLGIIDGCFHSCYLLDSHSLLYYLVYIDLSLILEVRGQQS